MADAPSQRQLRVGELVRHALSDVLARETLPDPELSQTVSISEVRMSPDLKIATVFVAPPIVEGGDVDAIVKALARNQKFLRGRMTPHLRQMRSMPQMRFREDTSFENFAKIDALLRKPDVARDLDKTDEKDGA